VQIAMLRAYADFQVEVGLSPVTYAWKAPLRRQRRPWLPQIPCKVATYKLVFSLIRPSVNKGQDSAEEETGRGTCCAPMTTGSQHESLLPLSASSTCLKLQQSQPSLWQAGLSHSGLHTPSPCVAPPSNIRHQDSPKRHFCTPGQFTLRGSAQKQRAHCTKWNAQKD